MPLRRSGQVCRGLVSLVVPTMPLVVVCLIAAGRTASAQSAVPIDPAYPGRYFADVDSSSANIDDILIFNPHSLAVTARVTFTKADGSGVTRDLVVSAQSRTDVRVQAEPNVGGGGSVSVAVQSLDAGRPLYAEHSQYRADRRGGWNTEGALPASTWYFAEGLADAAYTETITVYSLNAEAVTISYRFVGEDGSTTSTTVPNIGPGPARHVINVDAVGPGTAHGTIVTATTASGAPARVIAQRTTSWLNGDTREGASAIGLPAPQLAWYWADGGKGGGISVEATTVSLMTLPSSSPADVQVKYLHANGSVYSTAVTVPGGRRLAVPTPASVPDGDFAVFVTATNSVPIVADRTIYTTGGAEWGHASTPSAGADTTWYFAEGDTKGGGGPPNPALAVASLFLANPGDTSASVTIAAYTTDGTSATHTVSVPASQVLEVELKQIPGLEWTHFAMTVTSTAPIVAERRMTWQPYANLRWRGTSGSLGMRRPALETAPVFSPGGNTYAAPVAVTITHPMAGVEIRYTTDGSEPTQASALYTSPITIATNTILTAKAFKDSYQPGPAATAVYVITPTNEPLPPDPVTVAPSINPTTATNFAASMAFLYTGSNPIQRNVTPGAIEERRITILRGRVLDAAGTALAGARITALGGPQFGHTLSRVDGRYDFAVNGGGSAVVQIEKEGYLPVQRRTDTPLRDFVALDDVRLTALDPVVTEVSFHSSAPPQQARGSVVQDAAGQRQATLIIPEGGVHANLELPDGTVLPDQASLHIRATEYTVGAGGQQAMPGSLPPTSGYTYALELTADEALQAGATRVTFSPALAFYVENFLNFPVGGAVPAGYYDRKLGAWVASENGRIVRVLSVDGSGRAELDVTGSNTPADAPTLAALGITDGERQQLAGLYQPGQSLWRVPVSHFTPWDYNWPYSPPDEAEDPDVPEPEDEEDDDGDTCELPGSIIECQSQTLGERLPIAGTPFTLNYRSSRQPGYAAGRTLDITLTKGTVSTAVKYVEVQVDIAGQRWVQRIAPSPNQRVSFEWDGRDVYGRRIFGEQKATILVRHAYDAVYRTPAAFQQSFGATGGSTVIGDRGRSEISLAQTFEKALGVMPAHAEIGGWTLDAHHAFDPETGVVWLGNGSTRTGALAGLTVKPFYDQASMLGMAPDGSILASGFEGVVRIAPDGQATPQSWSLPSMSCNDQVDYAIAPDGTTYFASRDAHINGEFHSETLCLGRVAPDGTVDPVIERLLPEENYLANGVRIALAPDGTRYVGVGRWLYRIGPGEQEPVVIKDLSYPGGWTEFRDVAVGSEGSVYYSTHSGGAYGAPDGRIYRILPSGEVVHIAGSGTSGPEGEGMLAVDATLYEPELHVRPDGTVLLHDLGRIRRVSPQGFITTVAGGGPWAESVPNDIPARRANFLSYTFGVAPDGAIYITDTRTGGGRLYRVAPTLKPELAAAYIVPSENGAEAYEFDEDGRHLRTRTTASGIIRHTFEYDTAGQLTGIVDALNQRTTIERGGGGVPTALVGPFGQRTVLSVNGGLLASVTDPTSNQTALTYGTNGLLASLTTPTNASHTFDYDTLGRLISDTDPAGAVQTLSRVRDANGETVTLAHNAGFQRSYRSENLPGVGRKTIVTERDGLGQIGQRFEDAVQQVVRSDGTQMSAVTSPDPRFGMLAPFVSGSEVKTPSGLTNSTSRVRTVNLADPLNPYSVQTLTETTTVNGRTSSQVYDAASRTQTLTSPAGRQVVTTFNAQGQPTSVARGGGLLPITFTYDAQGQVESIAEGVRSTTYGYNAGGQVETVTDALSRTTTFGYDLAGRLTSQAKPGGATVAFGHDAAGNRTSVTPPSRPAHTFSYTPVDLVETHTPPVEGTAAPTSLVYRLDQQIDLVTRGDGTVLDYGYDAAGRLHTLTTPAGTSTWTYSPTSGRIASLATPDTTVTYAFDGVLPTQETFSGAVSGSVTTTWDGNFRPTAQSINGAHSVAFGYDQDGLITQAGALTVTRHAGNGLVTGTSIGSLNETRTLNGYGEVEGRQITLGGASFQSTTIARDDLGRITSEAETAGGVTDTVTYTYDAAGRLYEVFKNGALVARYTYDFNGNRRTTATGSDFTEATYDSQDRLVSWGTKAVTYTAAGELQTKVVPGVGTTTYEYDARSHLRAVTLPDGTTVSYVLDAANRRIARKIDGVTVQRWLYSGMGQIVAELDGSGAVVKRFVYGVDSRVPDYMIAGGVTYRLLEDHRGSIRAVTNVSTGAIAQQLEYDPWGRVLTDTNPGFQPFGFAAGQYDPLTGLVRFGERDYDAETGRWITRDPIGFSGGEFNLYSYVGADPINWIDPTGRERKPGKTPPKPLTPQNPSGWPPLPENVIKDPKWDSRGFWKNKNKRWCSWDSRSHGTGADRGNGPQGGHWDDEKSKNRWDIDGNLLPGSPDLKYEDNGKWTPYVIIGVGAGVVVIGATLLEDIATGGAGLLDDPATIAVGVGMIKAATCGC
jgi:RHS repeat-associated protein